jgi:catechol 2,3-dioxygenase-like lactoylglutathione lyase family enzyme
VTEKQNALQIFHVNVNCSDFDRSLAFYKTIGFTEYLDFSTKDEGRTFGDIGLGPLFRLPARIHGRATFLVLGDDHGRRAEPDRMERPCVGRRAQARPDHARHRPHLPEDP